MWPAYVLIENNLTTDELVAIRQNIPEVAGRPDTHYDKILASLQEPGDIPLGKFNFYFGKSDNPNQSYVTALNRYCASDIYLHTIFITACFPLSIRQ